MRILLDTHVFLWLITGDAKLPAPFLGPIRDPENEVYLSVVSLWEISTKYQLGKLPLPSPPQEYIPKQRELHQIASLPLTESDLTHLPDLPRIHRDPFDRILVCQTIGNKTTIATVDPLIMAYEVDSL